MKIKQMVAGTPGFASLEGEIPARNIADFMNGRGVKAFPEV